ncbi:hypothetical protein PMAYCL1PPCAC_31337, partial [Pristionchus mayeri]
TDDVSKAILGVILKKVDAIEVYQDFDRIDQNMTLLQGMREEFEYFYRDNEKRNTGVEELDFCFRLLDAYKNLKANFTSEKSVYFSRIDYDFVGNAFYSYENTVTILAPFLLKRMVTSELMSEDNDIGVHGTTLRQAYFYYTSLVYCRDNKEVHKSNNPHSPASVRVNGVVSLMPEFSAAFKCKSGDRMYAEEGKCRIFGKYA